MGIARKPGGMAGFRIDGDCDALELARALSGEVGGEDMVVTVGEVEDDGVFILFRLQLTRNSKQ